MCDVKRIFIIHLVGHENEIFKTLVGECSRTDVKLEYDIKYTPIGTHTNLSDIITRFRDANITDCDEVLIYNTSSIKRLLDFLKKFGDKELTIYNYGKDPLTNNLIRNNGNVKKFLNIINETYSKPKPFNFLAVPDTVLNENATALNCAWWFNHFLDRICEGMLAKIQRFQDTCSINSIVNGFILSDKSRKIALSYLKNKLRNDDTDDIPINDTACGVNLTPSYFFELLYDTVCVNQSIDLKDQSLIDLEDELRLAQNALASAKSELEKLTDFSKSQEELIVNTNQAMEQAFDEITEERIQKYREYESEIKKLNTDINVLARYKADYEVCQTDVEGAENHIKQLNDFLQKCEADYEKASEHFNRSINIAEDHIGQYSEKIKQLNADIDDKTRVIAKSKTDYENLTQQLEVCESGAQTEKYDMRKKFSESKAQDIIDIFKLEENKKTIEKLTKELQKCEEELRKKIDYGLENEQLKASLEKLGQQIIYRQTEKEETSKKIAELQAQNIANIYKTVQIDNAQRKIVKLNEELVRCRTDFDSLNSGIVKEDILKQVVEDELTESTNTNKKLESRIITCEYDLSSTRERNTVLTSELDKAIIYYKDLENSLHIYEDELQKIKEHSRLNDELRRHIISQEEINSELVDKNKSLEDTIEKVSLLNKSLADENSNCRELQEINEELKRQFNYQKQVISSIEAINNTLSEQYRNLETENYRATELNRELAREIQKCNDMNTVLIADNEVLEEENATLRTSSSRKTGNLEELIRENETLLEENTLLKQIFQCSADKCQDVISACYNRRDEITE